MAHSCPIRTSSSGGQPDIDRWEERAGGEGHSFCSWCGSLNSADYLSLIRRGETIDPTDKSYKSYVHDGKAQFKFYFEHLNPDDAVEFLNLLKSGQINLSFPGRFYVRPLFMHVDDGPSFAFSAIVTPTGEAPDGKIVRLIIPAYERLMVEIGKCPDFIHQIGPRQWEEVIAASYDKAGFDVVILTPQSGDLGRDVIATKKGFGSIKFIEQVKAYAPDHIVRADEVRALLGVLQSEQDASKAIFTTTSSFAPLLAEDRLIKPYLPTRLELVDKPKLIARLLYAPPRR